MQIPLLTWLVLDTDRLSSLPRGLKFGCMRHVANHVPSRKRYIISLGFQYASSFSREAGMQCIALLSSLNILLMAREFCPNSLQAHSAAQSSVLACMCGTTTKPNRASILLGEPTQSAPVRVTASHLHSPGLLNAVGTLGVESDAHFQPSIHKHSHIPSISKPHLRVWAAFWVYKRFWYCRRGILSERHL